MEQVLNKLTDLDYNVSKLTLGKDFDENINKDIFDKCKRLKYIKFLCKKITLKKDLFPNTVIYINFNNCKLEGSIIESLPNTLKYLIFKSNDFNQSIDNLPDSIIELTLGSCFNSKINKLPKSLVKLVFVKYCEYNIKFNKELFNDSNIRYLKFGYAFNQELDYLPNKLQYLILNDHSKFNKSLILPDSVLKLYLGGEFNQVLNINSLTHLICSKYSEFNRKIDFKNLLYFVLGYKYNQKLNPTNTKLKCIIVGNGYYHKLDENIEYMAKRIDNNKYIYESTILSKLKF